MADITEAWLTYRIQIMLHFISFLILTSVYYAFSEADNVAVKEMSMPFNGTILLDAGARLDGRQLCFFSRGPESTTNKLIYSPYGLSVPGVGVG